MSILLLHLDHSHGPAHVPQMCRSPKMCGSPNHHQMQIPGFQPCKTQESSRAAVFYIQCHPTIAIHIKVWSLPVHLEHRERGRESGRGGLMLMGRSLWRIVCPPSSFSLHHDELGKALFTGKSSYCPFSYLILTFSICTIGDCARYFKLPCNSEVLWFKDLLPSHTLWFALYSDQLSFPGAGRSDPTIPKKENRC